MGPAELIVVDGLICAALAGYLGGRKEMGAGAGFILGLISLLIVAVSRDRKPQVETRVRWYRGPSADVEFAVDRAKAQKNRFFVTRVDPLPDRISATYERRDFWD